MSGPQPRSTWQSERSRGSGPEGGGEPQPPCPPGSPSSSPEVLSRPSELDLQDIEEVEIGRNTFWPGE